MESTVVSEIVCQKIRLVDSQGDTVAVLGTVETEGTESPAPTFRMYNAEGLAALELSVDGQGAGSVVVFNKHEKLAATVQVDSDNDSGEITVWREGKIVVHVFIDADGGNLAVRGGGETAVHIYSDNEGGQVSLINQEGHAAVLAGADADGDGTVLTLADGNVTSRMPRGGR